MKIDDTSISFKCLTQKYKVGAYKDEEESKILGEIIYGKLGQEIDHHNAGFACVKAKGKAREILLAAGYKEEIAKDSLGYSLIFIPRTKEALELACKLIKAPKHKQFKPADLERITKLGTSNLAKYHAERKKQRENAGFKQ
ncbi:hypothetical protein Dip518_000630 [Parelusimicrobium proximum]|uniref:hypothetical protein n=1 Tax=Parelusimicrobium proximum TaxID=3228953 RepID=UPI003D163073